MTMQYEAICATCEAQGPACETYEGSEQTEEWAVQHMADNAGHHTIIKDIRE